MTTRKPKARAAAAIPGEVLTRPDDSHPGTEISAPPTLEQRLEARLRAFFAGLPRMGAWLALALLAGFLLLVVHRGEAIGSLAVTLLNMTAAGYVAYWFSRALERGRRPHVLFELAHQERIGGGSESIAARLELEANRILNRRFALIAACVLGSTFMKF